MKTTEDHILSDLKYHFAVKEEAGDYSDDTAFDYVNHDGIYGRFVLEEKHHVKTIIMVEARLPMPAISIDGLSYPLDADFTSIDEKIKITANTDYTEITVDTKKRRNDQYHPAKRQGADSQNRLKAETALTIRQMV